MPDVGDTRINRRAIERDDEKYKRKRTRGKRVAETQDENEEKEGG